MTNLHQRSNVPEFLEITPAPSVPDVMGQFINEQGLVLFESARRHERLGRYSFLAAEPIRISQTTTATFGNDPFAEVREWSHNFTASTHPDLPPFQGGFAGLLCYDLGHCWEQLPQPPHDEFQIPACVIGLYDWVIAWDHLQGRCWIIAHGFSASEDAPASVDRQKQQAQATLSRIAERLQISSPAAHTGCTATPHEPVIETEQFSFDQTSGIKSNFSAGMYQNTVQKVMDYIVEGDIFQANLSQRLNCETDATIAEIYLALREHNSAPFAGIFQHDDWAVLSSSPERFVQKAGNCVWTRPIKGTRQRHSVPEADLYTRDELRESQKDQAENVMIVDLLRNDLSRVCRPGTIRVPELCSIETYETVTHLVSEVAGELRANVSFWDVMQATFPGGSITGAPKIRAMEIITELEQVARGPYCGSLFYCGFDGTADSNILIRTLTKRGRKIVFPVGGGIVAQSNPQAEYAETLHKAAGMRAALASLATHVGSEDRHH